MHKVFVIKLHFLKDLMLSWFSTLKHKWLQATTVDNKNCFKFKFFFGTLISILDPNSFTAESINKDEDEFGRMLKKRAEDGGKIKVVSVSKVESEIEVKELLTLQEVIAGVQEKFPGFKHIRIPVYNSAAPLEKDFDTLCQSLIGSNVNTPVIVNCQVRTIRWFSEFLEQALVGLYLCNIK